MVQYTAIGALAYSCMSNGRKCCGLPQVGLTIVIHEWWYMEEIISTTLVVGYQSAYKTLSQLTDLPSWLYGVDPLVYTMFHWALPPSVTELTTVDPQLNRTVRWGLPRSLLYKLWECLAFKAGSNSAQEIWSDNGVVNQFRYSCPYAVVTSGWQTGCCGWKVDIHTWPLRLFWRQACLRERSNRLAY